MWDNRKDEAMPMKSMAVAHIYISGRLKINHRWDASEGSQYLAMNRRTNKDVLE